MTATAVLANTPGFIFVVILLCGISILVAGYVAVTSESKKWRAAMAGVAAFSVHAIGVVVNSIGGAA